MKILVSSPFMYRVRYQHPESPGSIFRPSHSVDFVGVDSFREAEEAFSLWCRDAETHAGAAIVSMERVEVYPVVAVAKESQ